MDPIDSKQPRFNDSEVYSLFMTMRPLMEQIPPYRSDSTRRDRWLSEHWQQVPIWSGMLRTEAALNANRGWTLTGGRNSVARARNVIKQHWVAPDVWGGRAGMMAATIAYHTSDLGAVIETARLDLGRNVVGPLNGFLHVDSTLCRLTGKLTTPLQYNQQNWRHEDYWRFCSLPSTREAYNGLGYCSTSQAVTVLQTLYLLHKYDLGELDPSEIDGFVLFHGMSTEQVREALAERNRRVDPDALQYFNRLAIIGTSGDEPLDVKLATLRNLPAGFENRQLVIDLAVNQLSLILMRDPAEFWPVTTGTFGRSTETAIQHQKATAKSSAELLKMWEERLNDETFGLPASVAFEWEERDDQGKLTQAQVNEAWARFAALLYAPGGAIGEPLFEREKVQQMLVQAGIVDPRMTEVEEEAVATDDKDTRSLRLARERALEQPRLRNYLYDLQERGGNDEIVQVTSVNGRERIVALVSVDGGRLCDPRSGEQLYGGRYRLAGWPTWRPAREIDPAREPVPLYRANSLQVTPFNMRVSLFDNPVITPDVGMPLSVQRAKEVLFEVDDEEVGNITITKADVDAALAGAADRVGDVWAELMDNEPLTDEELDALDGGS